MELVSPAFEARWWVWPINSAASVCAASASEVGLRPVLERCRAIVADDRLSADEKRSRLIALDEALTGASPGGDGCEGEIATAVRRTPTGVEHARHLIQAYRKEAGAPVFRSWSETLAFSRYAAAPVGRHAFDRHGEARDAWPVADALFIALWLCDATERLPAGGGRYLPQAWLRDAGLTMDDIADGAAGARLQPLYRKAAEAVETLLSDGVRGLRRISSPVLRRDMCRLAVETRRRARRLARYGPCVVPGPLAFWDRMGARMEGYRLWRRSM